MQSFISNGCVKQLLFICCTYKEQYKVYKQHPKNGITYENVINEYMLILEKFRNKYHQI
jgi:hypothetical protein